MRSLLSDSQPLHLPQPLDELLNFCLIVFETFVAGLRSAQVLNDLAEVLDA